MANWCGPPTLSTPIEFWPSLVRIADRSVGRAKFATLVSGSTLDPEDIDIAVDEVVHVKIAPVGAERDALGKATYIGVRHLGYHLSIDLQESHVGSVVAIKGGLWRTTGAVQEQQSGMPPAVLIASPSGPSPTTIWLITRGGFASISTPATVSPDRPVRHPYWRRCRVVVGANLDVERVQPAGDVIVFSVDLGVTHPLPIDIEQRKSISTWFDDESSLAIATAEGVAGGAAWLPEVAAGLASDTVSTTVLPSIDKILTESSARLATSASVPARLIAIPEGCLPASTVTIWTGGDEQEPQHLIELIFTVISDDSSDGFG
jgi:hypothetical protein